MTAPHYGVRRPGALTAASPGDTLYFQFNAHNDSGDSEAVSGFAVTDIEVFKNGIATTRATDSGYSLISDTGQMGDRVGLDRFSIQLFNTSDDTGHYEVGAWYQVAVDSVSIDGKTVRFWAGSFEIGHGVRADIRSVLGDTGAAHLDQGRFGVLSDTGRQAAVLDTGKVASAVWASHATRTLTAFALDTGIAQTVWRSSTSGFTSDTGSVGYAQGRLMAVKGDTGAAHLDGGRLGVSATATLDTGVIASAVWTSHQTRTLTAFGFDTGVAQTVWRQSTSTFTSDTGSVAYAQGRVMAVRDDTGAAHLDQGRFGVISDSGRMAAVLDTGKVAAAVWTSHATRTLTAFALDTGIRDTIWRASPSSYTSDTGSFGYAAGRVLAVRNDTGAAHLDQGRFGVLSDSGVAAAVLDTGKVASAVWTSHATRTLTAFLFDTGVADTVWKYGDTGLRTVNVRKMFGDTGAAAHLQSALANTSRIKADVEALFQDTGVAAHLFQAITDQSRLLVDVRSLFGDTGAAAHLTQAFQAQNTNSDTGLIANAAAIRTQTDKLTFDTGANELHADIRKVNNIQIQGAGDTGTGNTWRPV